MPELVVLDSLKLKNSFFFFFKQSLGSLRAKLMLKRIVPLDQGLGGILQYSLLHGNFLEVSR